MTPERESYFSARMNDLAGMFERFAGQFALRANPLEYASEQDPALARLKDEYLQVANSLGTEFDQEMQDADGAQWNALMSKCGAKARIDAALRRYP
jgi:hypothetical protein